MCIMADPMRIKKKKYIVAFTDCKDLISVCIIYGFNEQDALKQAILEPENVLHTVVEFTDAKNLENEQ